MAWNPSPEVAVARDAAKALGDAEMCIVVWFTRDNQLGMASFGKTKSLCQQAGIIGDQIYDYVMNEAAK